MNALHQLHEASNDTLLRRLHSELSKLRGGTGDFRQAAEALAEWASVPVDTAGTADAGRDSGGNQIEGVRV